jgi:hypothetical protein
MAGDDWTRGEVETAVADYRQMLIQELSGQRVNKAEHNRLLRQRLNGRNRGSVEFKHQNISAVLEQIGFPYRIDGYLPRGNFQDLLYQVVVAQLLNDPAFEYAALHASEQPAARPVGVDFQQWLEPPPPPRVHDSVPDYRLDSRVDYVAREARNRALGLAGEELVLDFERDRLERAGKSVWAGKVEHVSKVRGDSAGYDILSYEADGRERFIEVKTTAFSKASSFYISRNEIGFSETHASQYRLYRLFEFRKSPRMFEVTGSMRERLVLDPVSFSATVGTGENHC